MYSKSNENGYRPPIALNRAGFKSGYFQIGNKSCIMIKIGHIALPVPLISKHKYVMAKIQFHMESEYCGLEAGHSNHYYVHLTE